MPHPLSSHQPHLLLLGRVLVALLFVHEGLAKVANLAGAQRYVAIAGLPPALIYPAIALEIGCGLMLAVGLWTRRAAAALAFFCVLTAVLFHTKLSDVNQLLHFEKNLAIAGGLIALMLIGPGPWALTSRLPRRHFRRDQDAGVT